MTEELFTHQQVMEAVQAACESLAGEFSRWAGQAEEMAAHYGGEGIAAMYTYNWEKGRASAFRSVQGLVQTIIPTKVGARLSEIAIDSLRK